MKLITINGNGSNDYDVAVHRADCQDVAKAIKGHDYFDDEFDSKRELLARLQFRLPTGGRHRGLGDPFPSMHQGAA